MRNGFAANLFDGKTVVITGAGKGLGLAAARLFKQCGAKVIAHAGRSGSGKELAGIADHVLTADFSDPEGVTACIDALGNLAPRVDVLVNNAGTMVGRFAADALSQADYEHIVMLNQTSVVMLTSGLLPRIADGGAIINTVSISARTGGSPGSSIYSAAKGFVSTYTKSLARELAPRGIRVNAVSPGTILTDFHSRYSSAEKLEKARQMIPMQRLGVAEDCAPAYVFLAAESLSGYITGQVLEINGGQLIA